MYLRLYFRGDWNMWFGIYFLTSWDYIVHPGVEEHLCYPEVFNYVITYWFFSPPWNPCFTCYIDHVYALNEQLFGVFLFSSLALCPHAYCYTLLWSQKSEFFPEILLLFNRSMSEILFTLHHSYVRRKILFTLYGWDRKSVV